MSHLTVTRTLTLSGIDYKSVVVSEEQGEVEKFRKWNLDITLHRKLIQEGMDLPESRRNTKLPSKK